MKLYKYLSIAALVSLPLTGCSDFLNPDDKHNGNMDGTGFVESDPASMRPVAYNALRPIVTHLPIHEEATDLYIPSVASDGFGEFTTTPEDGTVSSYYSNCMKLVNYANGVIKFNGADSKIGAEGRFLRGLAYYWLLQQFGGVPYQTAYVESSTRDYPKSSAADIYANVIADLEDIYNNSELDAQNHNGVASKQAVAALLAKLYLAAAWDLDTSLNSAEQGTYTVNSKERFAAAAKWAETAINGVQLTMPFADKWSPSKEGNAEEIFSVQYDRAGYPGTVLTGGHQMMNEYMSYYGNCVVTGQKGTPSGGKHRMSYKALRLFEKGDQRWAGTFMSTFYNAPLDGQGNALWGKEGYLAIYNCTPAQLSTKLIAMKFYPSYYTEAEVRADLAGKESQTKKPATGKYGINTPFAAILGYPGVIVMDFNSDGTLGAARNVQTATFITSAGNNGTCVTKYDDPEADNVTRDNCYRDIPVFHVSDMYLIAAEAYLLNGEEGKALAKVNDVRKRAGAPQLGSFGSYSVPYAAYGVVKSFTPTSLDVILDERARELYAERTRYEDLRRTKQLIRYNLAFSRLGVTAAQMSNGKGEFKWLRPIPQEEINRNTALTLEDQNPGY